MVYFWNGIMVYFWVNINIEFYSNKFQYVKLKFNGSNIQHHKIELPSKVLPVADAELKKRLETKLNLFDQEFIDDTFSSVQELKDELNKLREEYLTKVKSREESLLDKKRKIEFIKAVKVLSDKIAKVKSESLVNIAKQINSTSKRLIDNLAVFLAENPKVLFTKQQNLWQNNEAYIKYASEQEAEKIVRNISWPKAHILLDKLNIEIQYSDITFEDLKNKKFIEELLEFKLIDEADEKHLASFSKGIETKEARSS